MSLLTEIGVIIKNKLLLKADKEHNHSIILTGEISGNSTYNEGIININTFKSMLPPPIQGQKGFSVEPTTEPFAVLGLSEMEGTNEVGHDNYGNYIHFDGSIVCFMPRMWYRIGHPDSPRYSEYGLNAIDILPISAFPNEFTANASGYTFHRGFIDGGQVKSGFFIDKYKNSKLNGKAVSVKFGDPISLTTVSGVTNSNGMITGCTGIYADSIYLSRNRGLGWQTTSTFMTGWLTICSLAQGQAAVSTDDCAWYDSTKVNNFPKGCNNNALGDVNDSSIKYQSANNPAYPAKPRTGSANYFSKTTHNGSNNGIADVNGVMWEVNIGLTNSGTSATDATQITTDQLRLLKESVSIKDLTGDFNTATSIWGNDANFNNKYDIITSPITIGSNTGVKYIGNNGNAVLDNSLSGVGRSLSGFLVKNNNSFSASGTNQFGNDIITAFNISNLFPISFGNWHELSLDGVFMRSLGDSRSYNHVVVGFRSGAYL